MGASPASVLGLPKPAYAHLPLVRDAEGRKLGKSLAALPVDAADPLPALRAAWAFLGQPPGAWPDGPPALHPPPRPCPADRCP